MFRPNEQFSDIVPRLEALHEDATAAELLILYFEPRQLHDKAADAVRVGKNAKEHIEMGLEISKEWQARSQRQQESGDPTEDELQEISSEEYGKLAEEAQREVLRDWERYPALAREAAVGKVVLREQLRLGFRRRLVHALAGAAVAAAVFVPPTALGIEFIHEQQVTSTSEDEGWTTGQKTAEALSAGSAILLGGLISFSTHGRRAGDRVANRKMRSKYGRPRFEEL